MQGQVAAAYLSFTRLNRASHSHAIDHNVNPITIASPSPPQRIHHPRGQTRKGTQVLDSALGDLHALRG